MNMDCNNVKQYIDETNSFIKETCEGKYTEEICPIQQLKELRYDYNIVEDVSIASEGIILYGLSH